jgi:hypothetical protein
METQNLGFVGNMHGYSNQAAIADTTNHLETTVADIGALALDNQTQNELERRVDLGGE